MSSCICVGSDGVQCSGCDLWLFGGRAAARCACMCMHAAAAERALRRLGVAGCGC